MSNELRERIAAVLRENFSSLSMKKMADAVIAELGLREELRFPGRLSFMPPQRRRYVTDWITDE